MMNTSPTPNALCDACHQPGVYIRTRYFENSIAHVWMCENEACAGARLYFHTDHPRSHALTRSPLFTPLFALDRLNSWLRSGDRSEISSLKSQMRSALKPVIYWVKTHAILTASKQCHCQFRRVMVKLKCRTCGGTGTWHHPMSFFDDYDRGEPCRNCQATGTATLKFIESHIGPIRWHTPQAKWWSSSLDVYIPFKSFYDLRWSDGAYELLTDWQPNTPGRPMPLADVLRDCRIVLAAYPKDFNFIVQYHYFPNTGRCWNKAGEWLEGLFAAHQ